MDKLSDPEPDDSMVRQKPNGPSRQGKSYPLTVYFDGACPICRQEIGVMKFFNRKDRLRFIDFSASSYRPADHGLSQCDLGRVIHAPSQ